MRTSATNRRLRLLLTAIADGNLMPRPEFQRRLVWTNKDKVAFVKTVLEGYPFPEIYIAAGSVDAETGRGVEMLVDGQQRITTLYQYFKGSQDIKLPPGLHRYSDLQEDQKREFLEYEVVIRDLGDMDIESIKRVFTLINSTSYSLNAMEIQNARFAGELKQFAEALADHRFFEIHHCFSATEVRRMQDVRYCLEFVITMMSAYFNRDSELESSLEQYNEDFKIGESLFNQISTVFSQINDLNFGATSRAWQKADLFTLLVEMHRALFKKKNHINVREVGQRLADFYDKVDQIQLGKAEAPSDALTTRYHRAVIHASTDRGNRITRGKIIQSLIDPEDKVLFVDDEITITH